METNKVKRHYNFNITETVDGKNEDVMDFDLESHHDLNALAKLAEEKENLSKNNARQLVVGIRLMHHVLKQYPGNSTFAHFLPLLNEFKRALKNNIK